MDYLAPSTINTNSIYCVSCLRLCFIVTIRPFGLLGLLLVKLFPTCPICSVSNPPSRNPPNERTKTKDKTCFVTLEPLFSEHISLDYSNNIYGFYVLLLKNHGPEFFVLFVTLENVIKSVLGVITEFLNI